MTAVTKMIEISRRGAILATIRERSAESAALVRVGAVAYSPMVQAVQSALVALGYDVGPLGADGILGPKTTEAIKKYQTDHGMMVTGTIEDATRDVVGAAAGAAGAIGSAAGGAAAKAASTEIAKTVKTEAASLVLPAVLMTVVVVLGGVAIWALLRKGV